jgi:hypothetical protein
MNASGSTVGPDRTFFSAPPDPPEISGIGSDEVTSSNASVSASVNPGNGPTVFWVDYGFTASYGSSTPASESVGDDDTDHPVTKQLSGLASGSTYHYRIVAANFGGVTSGPDRTFDTLAAPVISAVSSSGVGQTVATLEAQISAGFSATTYHFDYGLTHSYGSSTGEGTLAGADNAPRPVRADIANLRPGVTYHFRVVTTNPQGSAESADQTLVTTPIPPAKQTRQLKPVALTCKKGFVKKHGRCKKKAKPKKKHHGSTKAGKR